MWRHTLYTRHTLRITGTYIFSSLRQDISPYPCQDANPCLCHSPPACIDILVEILVGIILPGPVAFGSLSVGSPHGYCAAGVRAKNCPNGTVSDGLKVIGLHERMEPAEKLVMDTAFRQCLTVLPRGFPIRDVVHGEYIGKLVETGMLHYPADTRTAVH